MSLVAVNRFGEHISVGDEVTLQYKMPPIEDGMVFVVKSITPKPGECESGFLVSVHVKGDPENVLRSYTQHGRDTNWFRKLKKNE